MPHQSPDTPESTVGGGAGRGLDGLTVNDLRASREEWWDDGLTGVLLRWIPADTRTILDVGCGIGTAAHALLPRLENTSYLGIDADEERLRTARSALAGAAYAARARFRHGRAEQLPCADHDTDLVLSSMTLQHVATVPPVLAEIRRVLGVPGRFIAVEPDNLSNAFYFDGPLEELNGALRRLFAALREARRPRDGAIGPALPSMVDRAGLTVLDSSAHSVGRLARLQPAELFERARRVVRIASSQARLVASHPIVEDCLRAIDRSETATTVDCPGFGGQVVLIFVTVADAR